MFYTTDISVTLWILNMNKKGGEHNGRTLRDRTHEVLFIDLRTWDQNVETYTYDKNKRKKKTVLADEQIARVKSMYNAWQVENGGYEDVPELCSSVTLESEGGIRDKGHTLTPSKYIEFIDRDLGINYESEMSRIQAEMRAIMSAEKASQQMLIDAFRGIGYGID